MQLYIMSTVFKQLGFEVTTAQNGFEAFEIIQAIVKEEGLCLKDRYTKRFSLVLLDLNMPISNGFETCKSIHNLHNG